MHRPTAECESVNVQGQHMCMYVCSVLQCEISFHVRQEKKPLSHGNMLVQTSKVLSHPQTLRELSISYLK